MSALAIDLHATKGDKAIEDLAWDKVGATTDDRAPVLTALRTWQRAYAVAGRPEEASRLVAAGYGSALALSRASVDELVARTGLPPVRAAVLRERAADLAGDAAVVVAAMLDVQQDALGVTAAGNLRPDALASLRELPGYQELFGSLAFCACEACRSILGPAAYFVDLMAFVDEHLPSANHPLALRARRPDLWTLELTCDNTNQRVPTLALVAEILEERCATELQAPGDAAARRAAVYAHLAASDGSFGLPFHLPLSELDEHLGATATSRADAVQALGGPREAWALASLGLSPREHGLVVQPELDLEVHRRRYGIDFQPDGADLAAVEVQLLLPAMRIDRDAFESVVHSAFVAGSGAVLEVKSEKRTPQSVQADVENLHGLTVAALDRMHRLVRLARRVSWSIDDLDRVIVSTGGMLDRAGFIALAEVRSLAVRLGRTADQARAITGTIGAADPLLTERFAAAGLIDPHATFIHPAFRTTPPATVDLRVAALARALGLGAATLEGALRALAPALAREVGTPPVLVTGFDPADPDESQRGFVLNRGNLALLLRHTELAHGLRLTVDELAAWAATAAGEIGWPLTDGAGALALVEHVGWARGAGWSLAGQRLALGLAAPTGDGDPTRVAAAVVAGAASALEVEPTYFSLRLGLTEQGAAALVGANPAWFEPRNARLRVRPELPVESAALAIPPEATVGAPGAMPRLVIADEVRAAVRSIAPGYVLEPRLARGLRVSVERLRALAKVASVNLGSPGLARAFVDGVVAPIAQAVGELARWATALPEPTFAIESIEHIATERALYAAPTSGPPLLATLRALAAVAPRLRTDAAATRIALAAHQVGQGFPPSSADVVAQALDVDRAIAASLGARMTARPAAQALARLADACTLASRVGIDGTALIAMASDDYATLAVAAAAVTAAQAARPADGDDLAARLLAARRDALVDGILYDLARGEFADRAALSTYLLIDVDAGGCQTTSRVTAATLSIQQLLHRVVLGLERHGGGPGDTPAAALHLSPTAQIEWEWRKNYRVWEANRKVFLWPENYLEPSLRDDKTPLFETLESELLQGEVTEQRVLDAYANYLAGFEEVARLSIAGAYHDVRDTEEGDRDVLHLFGVASTDPPTLYHRTADNLAASGRDPATGVVWTPWRKVSLAVGRRVAPVVLDDRLHLFWTEIQSRPRQSVASGGTSFTGYQHGLTVKVASQRLDNTWTSGQEVSLLSESGDRATVREALFSQRPRYARTTHPEAVDGYSLSGAAWEGIWPELSGPESPGGPTRLHLWRRNFFDRGFVDLFARTMNVQLGTLGQPGITIVCDRDSKLYYGRPAAAGWGRCAYANIFVDRANLWNFEREVSTTLTPLPEFAGQFLGQIGTRLAGASLLAVPGNPEDVIVQAGERLALLQGSVTLDNRYVLRRLGTSLATPIARTLFQRGLDGLLSIQTQLGLREAAPPVQGVGGMILDRTGPAGLDFSGPYGAYFRELFFHVPMLIAAQLNAQGRFAAAQRFLHFVFNPTVDEPIQVPPGTPDDVRQRLERDRVWRYLELRGLDAPTLRAILTDTTALAQLRLHPFNPHAIARLRPSAYQRWVVMRYIDNLLDWADHLFTRFTSESVAEATLLYQTAQRLLGQRPAALGPCGERGPQPRDYEHIAPWSRGVDQLLVEVESWTVGASTGGGTGGDWYAPVPDVMLPNAVARNVLTRARERHPLRAGAARAELLPGRGDWVARPALGWAPALASATTVGADRGGRGVELAGPTSDVTGAVGSIPADGTVAAGRRRAAQRYCGTVVQQLSPVFCVPPNRTLWGNWDRVEDRLFKIHHCMDITGQRRELALTAPELDPANLVAQRPGALDGDERGPVTTGALPPYRFAYLIDRAKAAASTVASFGAALLSALERRDGEALTRLRTVQQKNLTAATTRMREWEVDLAREGLDVAERQRDMAIVRRDQLDSLIEVGKNGWETAEYEGRRIAVRFRQLDASMAFLAGALRLFPDVGSPFAMKYGGTQQGGNMEQIAVALGTLGTIADAQASLEQLEGGHQRRDQAWRHQRELARRDVRVQDRQVVAANLRLKSAERGLVLHHQSLAQQDELLAALDGKVTNLELYGWYAREMQRLHRSAFDHAMTLARLAEHALQFERGDRAEVTLSGAYWEPGRAGLMAGERLLLELQAMERHFLESHHRELELDQAFSLAHVDAEALVALRTTGTCELAIPELFFDLAYPGHYRRRIRAVRLTIPCVTGPYVNVSATLELVGSHVRPTPSLAGSLVPVPPQRTTAIATSSAQNDAGVFELSFRDERYLPFEGAGAVSQWRLRLPATFRSFDYTTINDVVISISYTALHDEALRARVETDNAELEGTLRRVLAEHALPRVLSLRHDAPTSFSRLMRAPVGTSVGFEVSERHLPTYVRGRPLAIEHARLALRLEPPVAPSGLVLRVDGVDCGPWAPAPDLGGLWTCPLPPAFAEPTALRDHTIAVVAAGDLAPSDAGSGALDGDRLLDLLVTADVRLT